MQMLLILTKEIIKDLIRIIEVHVIIIAEGKTLLWTFKNFYNKISAKTTLETRVMPFFDVLRIFTMIDTRDLNSRCMINLVMLLIIVLCCVICLLRRIQELIDFLCLQLWMLLFLVMEIIQTIPSFLILCKSTFNNWWFTSCKLLLLL